MEKELRNVCSVAKRLARFRCDAQSYRSSFGPHECPANNDSDRQRPGNAEQPCHMASLTVFLFTSIKKHDHEHEEDHDCARIHDHLDCGDELGAQKKVLN